VPTLWADGHVSVGDLWKVYASYPYMPRLRDRGVLNAGLTAAVLIWTSDGFALAEGHDTASGRYRGLMIPNDHCDAAITDATLVVRPDLAQQQREAELPDAATVKTEQADSDSVKGATEPAVGPQARRAAKTRYFGTKQLSPDRYGTDFKKVADEILSHLSATSGVHLTVRVEIEAITDAGFDSNRIRVVSENATTLKFEQSSFEDQ